MGCIVKEQGGSFTLAPEGNHMAVCNMVVDIGHQETGFGIKPKIYIRWEMPSERISYERDGETIEGPCTIGAFYTASLNEKANLRKDLESWRGRTFTKEELEGFDVFNVLGVACQITIIHRENNGKEYANVSTVVGLPKGVEAPEAENPLLKYSPDDPDSFHALPEWLQKKVQEGNKQDGPDAAGPDEGDGGSDEGDGGSDVPF